MFRRDKKGSSSRRAINNNNNNNQNSLGLKFNLSTPPRVERVPPASALMPVGPHDTRMSTSSSSEEVSPPRSCVSSEESLKYSSSPDETTSMVLVGCPRCLMYVMLSEIDPRCPKCKSTVLLDFLHHDNHPHGGGGGCGNVNDNDNDDNNDDMM